MMVEEIMRKFEILKGGGRVKAGSNGRQPNYFAINAFARKAVAIRSKRTKIFTT
jgi:hypothetical protein